MTAESSVRPTKRCLDSIGINVPDLGVRLSNVEHVLVVKAQQIPQLAEIRSAERIRSLTDRVWLKAKTSSWRGAVGELAKELPPQIEQFHQDWWLCAAGRRQEGSAQADFYAVLTSRAYTNGPHSCSTDFLLPNDWDVRRLLAEGAVIAQSVLSKLVLQAAAGSLLHSDVRTFVVGDRDVRVRIRVHDDGQVYLALSATGTLDHTFFVALMSAIPGLTADDWMPEPEGGLSIAPDPGEIIWSALLTTEIQEILAAEGSLE